MEAINKIPENLRKEKEILVKMYLNNDTYFDWDEFCEKFASPEYNEYLKKRRQKEQEEEKSGIIVN